MSTVNIVGLVVLVVVVVAIKYLLPLLLSKSKPTTLPYVAAPLLSPAELSFMRVLEQAVGSDYRISPKVRLGDVIDVKRGLSRQEWQSAFNRIQSKHIDFLICDADYLTLCAIELDDSSHEQSNRQDRDDFVNKALWSAGIKLVRFTVKSSYSVQDVVSVIEKVVVKRQE